MWQEAECEGLVHNLRFAFYSEVGSGEAQRVFKQKNDVLDFMS